MTTEGGRVGQIPEVGHRRDTTLWQPARDVVGLPRSHRDAPVKGEPAMKRLVDRMARAGVLIASALVLIVAATRASARASDPVEAEGQPLAANVERVVRTL